MDDKNEYEVHKKIKYGDIIYIEITNQKKRIRNILTAGDFKIKGKFDVEIKRLNLSNDSIYLKDFENNLFIIFPKMKDEFMNNKTSVNNGISMLKERINTSKKLVYDSEFKNDITKVIQAFQETKQNVYSENEKFMEYIGKPINYEDDFILIHFKSQNFVKKNENKISNRSSSLSLTSNYSEDCIFFFSNYNYLSLSVKNIFSNQNVLICKREKNVWINTHFLIAREINAEKNKKEFSNNNPRNNNIESTKNETTENSPKSNLNITNLVLDFNEGQGQAFQVKVCSDYIDPSSTNLSFATPVWLVLQSVDKYLNITTINRGENVNTEFEPIHHYRRTSVNSVNNINRNNNDIMTNGINRLHYNINSAGNYSIITRSNHPLNILNDNENNINNAYNNQTNEQNNANPNNIQNYNQNNNQNNIQNNNQNNIQNNNQNNIQNNNQNNNPNNNNQTNNQNNNQNNNPNNNNQNNNPSNNPDNNQENNPNIRRHITALTNLTNNNIFSHFRHQSSYIHKKQSINNAYSSPFKISFDTTDKEKSINSINGLFYIEQYKESEYIKLYTDEYLKQKMQLKMELKMPSYVEFHKIVRFRHITTKKYLGFEEKIIDNIKLDPNDKNKDEHKGKTIGSVILLDVPNDYCNFMLLESYKLLENKQYLKSKVNGIKTLEDENKEKEEVEAENEEEEEEEKEEKEEEEKEKEDEENKNSENSPIKNAIEEKKEVTHKIKNNEILRIFHIKTQKFLCFDEVNNKFGDKIQNQTIIGDDLYRPKAEKKIYVHNLTLSKVPYDSDLIRLIPSDTNQAMEISIVLHFKKQLSEQIDYLIKKDFKKILGIQNNNSLRASIEPNTNPNANNDNNNPISNNINNDNNNPISNNINSNNNQISNINELKNKTFKSVSLNYNYNNTTTPNNANNNINRGSLNVNYGKSQDYKNKKTLINELKAINNKTLKLLDSFRDITDYCQNKFSKKYDINISPGKPLFYRQQFLYDQGLLKKTFKYLENTKSLNEIYRGYAEYEKKKLDKEEETEKIKKTLRFNEKKNYKTFKSFEKKNFIDLNNNPDFIILEIFKHINETIRKGFEFIYAMCKNNSINKKIAFNHKNLFLYYFLEYEEASKCFMDLLKENENIMNLVNKGDNQDNKFLGNNLDSDSEEYENNIIDKILLYLNKSKVYETKNLSLLSKFLIIGDSGITSNQQYIFEELFYKGKDRFLIKIKPLYNDIEFRVVYRDQKNYCEKNLEEFCNNRILAEEGVIKYLAEQLNLYANLCYGRNYVCIEKIRKIFPLDHLIYHISKIELNQEILAGLINILNYVYIDIEPHIMNVSPSLIKRVAPNLRIERISKDKVKTYIPLNKLNLILCISLFLLNNIKYGTVLVNAANINMIYNIIKFHLYENVVYSPMNIGEVINNNLDQRLHNLKDEVKYNVIYGEELLNNRKTEKKKSNKKSINNNNEVMDEISDLIDEEDHRPLNEIYDEDWENSNEKAVLGNINSFYNKFGYKFIDYNFDSPLGEEYILFVLDRINDFFLHSLILNNTDNNTENKNIISQNFKSVSSNDILTQSNINYLMETLIEIKNILTKENNELDKNYILIMKQIEKVINFILDIKSEDMSVYLLENLLKINYQIIDSTIKDKENSDLESDVLFSNLREKLFNIPNIKEILMDNEFYYYQLFNKINYYDEIPKFFSNSVNISDNEILSALLKRDKSQEENRRLLNNSLFDEESSLIENNYSRYKDIQELTNNYFSANSNLVNEGYHDSEYYYNLKMPTLEINFENFFMNSVIFKNLMELIIRILEMNVNAKMTKILLRIYKRLISQKKELFECIKNVLLLYKNEDLQKYYLCNTSIKELALLAEKTEKWMTDDHVPKEIRFIKSPSDLNLNELEDDKKDFFLVYSTIYRYLSMIIDNETNAYYQDDEVKLIQKIFYSFQMENILSSLMKEIIQEYPSKECNNNTLEILKNNISVSKSYNSKASVRHFLKKQKSKKNKIIEDKKEKELVYKIALEKLIKIIFKLFLALIHNTSPNINKQIIDLVDFSKEYKYLLNFGLLKLIVELSSDEKYVLYNTNYLLDLINDQINIEYIKSIKNHFYDYNTCFQNDNYAPSQRANVSATSKRSFQKVLKRYSFLLKLMKNVITILSDEKHLGILLQKFVEIITEFDLLVIPISQTNNLNIRSTMIPKDSRNDLMRKTLLPTKTIKSVATIDIKSNNNQSITDINCKIGYYKMSFIYYLIKASCELSKKNQQLKQYILNLFSINHLIKFIFELYPPFSEDQINYIIESNQYKETKLFLKIQNYFKVKYIGCTLILSLSKNLKYNRKYISKNMEKYYSRLKEDLDYAFYFSNQIENFAKFNQITSNYYFVYEKYRRNMYKYFFKGIFPLIYYHLSTFSEKLFKNNEDYQRTKNNYIKINKKWENLYRELYNEKNQKAFKKLFIYIGHRKKDFYHVFSLKDSITNYNQIKLETRTTNYIQNLKRNLVGPEKNKLYTLLQDPKNHENIMFEITINFVNDIINEIEDNEIINKCIIKEKKIMARHLKAKINFHSILKRYVENETRVQTDYQIEHEAEIHLVNVFLKFIQENADNKKYFHVMRELIELMAYIVSVTPEILKREYKVKKNNLNYFDQKILEFKENFIYECQKSFLNNGAIEIFLKIACQGGKYFHQKTFDMIIYFFNSILEGGNTEVQKKFIQLFQLLPNSSNFFRSIYQSFNKDIFDNLNDDPFIEEINIDNKKLIMVTDKLRFLQLLAENHNSFLQNYLREQTNNRMSYNFINILIEYLSMLLEKLGNLNDKYKILPRYCTELYYKRLLFLLDTICEFLQGPCKQNQENLIDTKVVELFNKIMDETCIIAVDEDKKEELNNDDNYVDQNTVFTNSNKKFNPDSFFSETITYTHNNNSGSDEKIYYGDNNMKQNKIFSSLSDFDKSMLLFKISLVLLSIIEGRRKKDSVIKKILRDINYKLVFEKCGEIYDKLKNEMYFFLYTEENTKDIEDLDDKIVSEAGFNLYFLMEMLISLENEETELKVNSSLLLEPENKSDKLQKEKLQEIFRNSETIIDAIDFYSENSLSIEILKDDEIFKVFCPKLQFFNAFDEKMRKDFDDNADRSTIQTKLMSLINKKEQIYMTLRQINNLESKYKKFWPLKYLLMYPNKVQLIGLILIIIMNFFIFIGYNAENDKDQHDVIYNVKIFELNETESKVFLQIFGVIILCFIILMFIEFMTKDAILIYKNLYTNFLKNSYEKKITHINDLEIRRVHNFLKSSGSALFFNKLLIYLKLLCNFRVLYSICFMIFAILGIVVHNFFFAFHLIEFIKNHPILQYVFLAFIEPLAEFVYTYIFFFILIYFYSLLIFYHYFYEMPDNTCDSPLICMMYIYSNTFTSGGNLGNFIDTKEESMNVNGDMKRYLLDISYTIIMVWLVWQMVSGLIVDTFDSLRGDREEIEEDMDTICFICGLNREKIEKYYIGKEGFEKHLQDHNIDNYFFYMFYLEEKDPNEYSGLESYVKEHVDKESISWFPIGRSLKIEDWEMKHKS